AILFAVGIGGAARAIRIIAPLAIHLETVFVAAGGEGDCRFPGAILRFLERNRIFLPIRETSNKFDALSLGGADRERFFGFGGGFLRRPRGGCPSFHCLHRSLSLLGGAE